MPREAGFFRKADFNEICNNSHSFEEFLQGVANYAIERFLPTGRNPPDGKVEELLNAIIGNTTRANSAIARLALSRGWNDTLFIPSSVTEEVREDA